MELNNLETDREFFSSDTDINAFRHLLNYMDNLDIIKISREEFDFIEDILSESKDWNVYIYIPEDLTYWELIYFIDELSQRFWIESYTNYSKIITYTKIAVLTLLKDIQELDKDQYLKSIQQKYKIPDETAEKIKSQKINLEEAKKLLETVKNKRQTNGKLCSEDFSEIEKEVIKVFNEEFQLLFFRRWISKLESSMMNFTRDDYKDVKHKLEKDSEIVNFHVGKSKLDKDEKLLKDKIWLEMLKENIDSARESNDPKKIEEAEFNATDKILKTLYTYPYQNTSDWNWDNFDWILKTKETQCVWYSLLWHTFLRYLWIKHYKISKISHAALEVVIQGKKYYFDPTYSDTLFEITSLKENNDWLNICLGGKNLWDSATFEDPEKGLLTSIIKNSTYSLLFSRNFSEIIYLADKMIELNPYNYYAYYKKGMAYEMLDDFEQAEHNLNQSLMLNSYYKLPYALKQRIYLRSWICHYYFWNFEFALEFLQQSKEVGDEHLKLGGNHPIAYESFWDFYRYYMYYLNLDKKELQNYYLEIIKNYDKALTINPKDSIVLYKKWKVLEEKGDYYLSKLYKLASLMISWKPYENLQNEVHSLTFKMIQKFVKEKNFVGLNAFLGFMKLKYKI